MHKFIPQPIKQLVITKLKSLQQIKVQSNQKDIPQVDFLNPIQQHTNYFMLTIKSPANFRQVILCSIIAEQPLQVQDINNTKNPPGLKPQESRFLHMIQQISNGCKIIVTKGGQLLKFYPGLIVSNEGVELTFDCGKERCISYYLEYLILIAMFGKNSLNIKLTGITNDSYDTAVDTIQQHLIPLLKEHYQFDNQLSMKIVKRGYLPDAGGQVHIVVPTIRKLKQVNILEKGYIKRIRGICSGSKISTSILNQVKDQCKNIFLNYIPDVWIYTDYFKGDKASQSPGYSLALKAQTTTGGIITFDACYEVGNTEAFTEKACNQFLDEIEHSGIVSTNYQWFLLTLMALSERKTSSVKLGRVSPFTVECLRIIKDFFGVIFEIEQSKSENLAILRCLGIGYENYARIAK